MSAETPTRPVPRGRLLALTLGALLAAVLIVTGAILPAEFDRDPLGLGRLTGLSRLWAPPQREIGKGGSASRTHSEAQPFRTDVIEIPLGGFLEGAGRSELEYKVRMTKDSALLYAWEVIGAERADDVRHDFHGHTTPNGREGMDVATYEQADGLKRQGSLIAPFDGIQGWQLSNSGEKPVIVRVRLAGFYELIPSGQPGNEGGIVPNVPAAQARPNAPPPANAAR